MLALRRIIEEIKIVNWQPTAVFAVFSKAFDSVTEMLCSTFYFSMAYHTNYYRN